MKNVIQVILLFIFLPMLRCQTRCSSQCLTPGSPPNICERCINGCYLDSKTNNCYQCSANCLICNSKKRLSCETGYFNYLSFCYRCNQNCKTKSDGCKCKTCNDGYYFTRYRCYKCSTNCKTCSDSSESCSDCYEGYFLLLNKCYECNSNCKTCSGTATNCSSCYDGY